MPGGLMKKNIVLIGFMATGKTTVGRRLASRLGLAFVDTDLEVEKVVGRTVAEIFYRYGIIRFRSEEALVIKKLSAMEGLVIATGGGAVLDPENVKVLKQNGLLIRLTASPDIIYQRVKNKRTRPLLDNAQNLPELIRRMMAEREEFYRRAADFSVDTGLGTKEQAVNMIISFLRERMLLDGGS